MNTPSIWILNVMGLDSLNAEANKWFGLLASATTPQDRADAKAYLSAVIAERDQRLAGYSEGLWGAAKAGLAAPFEALGGSHGAGASGLAAAAADKAAAAAAKANEVIKTALIVGAVGLIVAGALYSYQAAT